MRTVVILHVIIGLVYDLILVILTILCDVCEILRLLPAIVVAARDSIHKAIETLGLPIWVLTLQHAVLLKA
jgi:hypothetical protein